MPDKDRREFCLSEPEAFGRLVDGVRAGLPESETLLHEAFQSYALSRARKHLNHHRDLRRLCDAEDVCQVAWTAVFKRLCRPDAAFNAKAFIAYLTVTVDHQVGQERRRWRRQCRDLGRDVSFDAVGGDPTVFSPRALYNDDEPPGPAR